MASKKGVINEIFDLQELERQKKAAIDAIQEYIKHVESVQPVRAGLQGAESFKVISTGIKDLTTAYNQNIKLTADASKAAEEYIKKLKAQETAQRALDKAFAEGKLEKQNYNKELKTEIELQNAANGSIKQAQTLIKSLKAERDNLNLTTEEGRKRQAELNAEINRQNAFIEANVDALSQRKINVGNYEGSAKIIVDALERTRQKLAEVEKDFGKASPEASALRTEFEALRKVTENPQFLNIASKVGDTNKELRFFTQRLNELEDAGLKNSAVYNDVRSRLAALTDQIGDTRAEIKAMASDTRGFDLFASSIKTLASVWQTAAGAAQLFGADTENVERSIQRLVAIQSVANGVQQIATELTTKGTAANKAFNFVLQQGSILFGKASTAAQRFGAALKFSAIGITITLLGKVADSLGLFSDKTEEAEKAVEELNKQFERTNELTNQIAKNIEIEGKLQIENLKQQLANRRKFYDEDQKNAQQSAEEKQKIGEKEIEVLRQLEEVRLNNQKEAAAKLAEAEDKIIKYRELKAAGLNRFRQITLDGKTIQQLEKEREAYKKFYDENAKLAVDATNTLQIALAQQRTDQSESNSEARENESKRNKEALQKQLEEIEKSEKERLAILEANRQAEFEILQTRVELYKENDLAILDNEELSFADRLSGLAAYLNDSKKLILAQSEFELGAANLTAGQIDLIQEKRNADLYRAQQDFYKRLEDLTKDAFPKDAFKVDTSGIADAIKPITGVFEKAKSEGEAFAKSQEELKERLKEAYTQLGEELKGLFFDLFTNGIENEKNALQEQINLLEQQKQKDIEVADQTIVNEQKKADTIAVIEAKAAAQREQLEQRKRVLDQQRARWEKAENVANIIQATAIAVVNALGSKPWTAANIALAAVVGTIGAAQIARVIATPIPRYFRGRDENDPYMGPAIVDDGGKPEAIIRKSGDVEIGSNKPRITWMNKGDIVLPDARQALLNGLILNQERATAPRPEPVDRGYEIIGRKIDQGINRLDRTIRNKKEFHFDRPTAMQRVMQVRRGNKEYYKMNGFDVD